MLPSITAPTHFRLSLPEIELIRTGLDCVVIEHRAWERHGQDPCSAFRRCFRAMAIDEGEYSPADMGMIVQTLGKLREVPGASKRLHMDAMELAACILGARVTQQRVRHGHVKSWLPDHKAATRALLKKLERLRKRAKRLYIRVHGLVAFQGARHRWQRFVPFVRTYFLFCTCHRPLLPGFRARLIRRLLVEDWMKRFREDFHQQNLPVPPEAALRNVVQRALRMGRRYQRAYGLRYASQHRGLLQQRIWDFVAKRCMKLST